MATKSRKLAYNPLDMLVSDVENWPDEPVAQLDPGSISPNPNQPRQHSDSAEQQEMEASVRAGGVHQPLVVRPIGDGGYELVAGSRRLAAALAVGLPLVPVMVRAYTDEEAEQVALVENLQRANLRFDDEALALQRLKQRFKLTNESLARSIGKSTDYVELRIAAAENPTVLDLYMAGAIDQKQIRATIRRLETLGWTGAGDAAALLQADDPNGSDQGSGGIIADETIPFEAGKPVPLAGPHARRTRRPPDGWRWTSDAEKRLRQLPDRVSRMEAGEKERAREQLLKLREAADRAIEMLS